MFIILFVFVIVIYLLYKAFIAYLYYRDLTIHEDNSFPVNQNIETISIHNNKMANTVALNNNLNIFIPEGFELITDRAKSNYVMNDCEPYIKGLKDKETFDAMILICYNTIDIGNMEKLGIRTTFFPWLDLYSLMEKYNIHDSVDMIKFYEKHYHFKKNLFTSSDDIKMNYIARTYTTMTLSSYDKYYYLDNDLRGYSIEYARGGEQYFQQTELIYNTALYGETKYGVSFHNNKED